MMMVMKELMMGRNFLVYLGGMENLRLDEERLHQQGLLDVVRRLDVRQSQDELILDVDHPLVDDHLERDVLLDAMDVAQVNAVLVGAGLHPR